MGKELQNLNYFIPGSRLVAVGNCGSAHAGQMAKTCQKLNKKICERLTDHTYAH